MSAKTIPVALGFRAVRGGSVVVGIAFDGREPRVALSTFLATAAEGDRVSLEPYHVAAEIARRAKGKVTTEAAAAVTEGRKRQDRLAADGLAEIIGKFKDTAFNLTIAALLVNRAGWVTDLLQYSLGAPEHPPVAEGLAVRDALRFAFRECRIKIAEMDEKSLPETASAVLGLSPANIDARLKAIGATAGKPWRKEQKLAALAAWLALIAKR